MPSAADETHDTRRLGHGQPEIKFVPAKVASFRGPLPIVPIALAAQIFRKSGETPILRSIMERIRRAVLRFFCLPGPVMVSEPWGMRTCRAACGQ